MSRRSRHRSSSSSSSSNSSESDSVASHYLTREESSPSSSSPVSALRAEAVHVHVACCDVVVAFVCCWAARYVKTVDMAGGIALLHTTDRNVIFY